MGRKRINPVVEHKDTWMTKPVPQQEKNLATVVCKDWMMYKLVKAKDVPKQKSSQWYPIDWAEIEADILYGLGDRSNWISLGRDYNQVTSYKKRSYIKSGLRSKS